MFFHQNIILRLQTTFYIHLDYWQLNITDYNCVVVLFPHAKFLKADVHTALQETVHNFWSLTARLVFPASVAKHTAVSLHSFTGLFTLRTWGTKENTCWSIFLLCTDFILVLNRGEGLEGEWVRLLKMMEDNCQTLLLFFGFLYLKSQETWESDWRTMDDLLRQLVWSRVKGLQWSGDFAQRQPTRPESACSISICDSGFEVWHIKKKDSYRPCLKWLTVSQRSWLCIHTTHSDRVC